MYYSAYDMDQLLQNMPPPPSEAPPKPPRRVSTIMMGSVPEQARGGSDEFKQPAMKRLQRVINMRRVSKEKKELERCASEADPSSGFHLDAFAGRIGIIERAIKKDKYIVNRYFNYSPSSLLTEAEVNNPHYIPPPALPKLIRMTLKKPVETMTLDQRWLLTNSFANSTLLHYACAGDQREIARMLLESGADWTLMNAVDKTADMYTNDEAIRELFINADTKYNRLPPLIQRKTMEETQPPPPPFPATSTETVSILKSAASTGRRRQSIVNDASWTDSNLRSTVHHSVTPNIRGSVVQGQEHGEGNGKSSAKNLRSGGSDVASSRPSFRRPDEDDYYDEYDNGGVGEEGEPIETYVPMSFGNSTKTAATTSTYSLAETVQSDLEGLELRSNSLPIDEASVGSVGTGASLGTGTDTRAPAVNINRLSSKRRSRVVQSLRSRGSIGGGDSSAPARRVPPPPPPPPSAPATASAIAPATAVAKVPLKKTLSKSKKSNESAELTSSDSKKTENRSNSSKKIKKTKSSKLKEIMAQDERESDEPQTQARKEKPKAKGTIKRVVKPPPPQGSEEAKAEAQLTSTSTDKHSSISSVAATVAPPLRVMRRLSVNITQNALEAVSFVVGADGEQKMIVSAQSAVMDQDGSLPSSPEAPTSHKSIGTENPPIAQVEAETIVDTTAAKKKAALAHVAESGDDAYLEAWECKATDQSPFARIQNAFFTTQLTEANMKEADLLIAKAKQLEKQEKREARQMTARAGKLQEMLGKLTPIEHIASGLLHAGGGEGSSSISNAFADRAAGVARLLANHSDGHEHEYEDEHEHDSVAKDIDGEAEVTRAVANNIVEDVLTSRVPVATQQPHSLTYREMIWRRAGYHMNSALGDVHSNDYQRLRIEAYHMGMRLLKKEFQSYANKDRWEAVDMVEEQRLRDGERQLKASARIMLGLSQSQPQQIRRNTEDKNDNNNNDNDSSDIIDRSSSSRHDSFVPFSMQPRSSMLIDTPSELVASSNG